MCGRLYLAAAWVVARQIAEAKAPTTALTPASFIFSISAAPACGWDCASPSSASILAPPSDLMPPALLMSSMAIRAPSRHCWPEYARAPVTGCRTPTLTDLTCAPPTRGKASAEAAAADWEMKIRRVLMGVLLMDVKSGTRRNGKRKNKSLMELGGQLFADPHLGVNAAHA